MGYYLALKRKGILIHCITQLKFENTMLFGRSQIIFSPKIVMHTAKKGEGGEEGEERSLERV
jgi:hypothetical protein